MEKIRGALKTAKRLYDGMGCRRPYPGKRRLRYRHGRCTGLSIISGAGNYTERSHIAI
jgi:hypothetical protein